MGSAPLRATSIVWAASSFVGEAQTSGLVLPAACPPSRRCRAQRRGHEPEGIDAPPHIMPVTVSSSSSAMVLTLVRRTGRAAQEQRG